MLNLVYILFFDSFFFIIIFLFFVFIEYESSFLISSCSNSSYPKLVTKSGDFSNLLEVCGWPVLYVKNTVPGTGGASENVSEPQLPCGKENPCQSISEAFNNTRVGGYIYVCGVFHDENITIPPAFIVNISSDPESTRANLTYLSNNIAPFFTVDFGELSISDIVIVVGSSYKGAFLHLTDSLILDLICLFLFHFSNL
jgi:hypothetical protein